MMMMMMMMMMSMIVMSMIVMVLAGTVSRAGMVSRTVELQGPFKRMVSSKGLSIFLAGLEAF